MKREKDMSTEESTRTILSVEELTLFSLDQSQSGLDDLITQCSEYSELITSENLNNEISRLVSFTDALYTLDAFVHNIYSLFIVDREKQSDPGGNMESNILKFRSSMQSLCEHLEKQDFQSTSLILIGDLKGSLMRFKELFPLLRTYVDKEYLATVNAT